MSASIKVIFELELNSEEETRFFYPSSKELDHTELEFELDMMLAREDYKVEVNRS